LISQDSPTVATLALLPLFLLQQLTLFLTLAQSRHQFPSTSQAAINIGCTQQAARMRTQQVYVLFAALLAACVQAQQGGALIDDPSNQVTSNVIIVDGFVDTETCHDHLLEADKLGNNDGLLQADEFVTFAQLQTPGGQLDDIEDYQSMPLVMQATFVTLTCLCRDERFGGDSRDVNCCLGVDAHISIVGSDDASTAQEKTRLFATCFLTDQAIVSVLGSEPPSSSPTVNPTLGLTPEPTTKTPTNRPSALPTGRPTQSPTTGPPVVSPTTTMPSQAPVTTPPTIQATTTAPTMAPTTLILTPSPTPVVTPVPLFTQSAKVVYTVAVANATALNIQSSVYENDLVNAMDQMATTVVASVFVPEKIRHRNLQVKLSLPTEIATYEVTSTYLMDGGPCYHAAHISANVFVSLIPPTGCPAGLAGPNDRCENVEHLITMIDTVELDPDEVLDFERALVAAISRGELQDDLPPDSIVTILTGMVPAVPIVTSEEPIVVDEGLSSGATAGIIIAALVVTILPIALYLSMKQKNDEKEPYGSYQPHDSGSADGIHGPAEDDIEDQKTPLQKVQSAGGVGSATLGASPTDYGKSYTPDAVSGTVKQVHGVPPVSPERDGPDHHSYDDGRSASSSNAGSSGWSSSAGLSSLNTGSAEDSMDMLNSPQGSSLAAIGAASAVARRVENRRNISP
jgi:hypothetical protein